ncbi:MAG: mucoidy inhibitor MuiA family protein [Winogradskyella sp.]|uniref:mucoidy inhibitor MuiA family protein n=1 Tax=Winogradskyella sp. TaxID=1883156 RepID=UPI0025FEB10B|nr:mucoidy inhibitor MuiA family protein [Winogradskyella sp.]NRB60949.1 mucoidy inhibitor MuiA family protein [Winogradskyella sp.]
MKLTIISILFLVSLITTTEAQEKTKITDVTVYLDGAEITRIAEVTVPKGNTEFIFNKLSPLIEESSIQVSGLNNTSILSINYGINYLTKQKQNDSITELQNELKVIQNEIQHQYNLIEGYNEELSLIKHNKSLSTETEAVTLEELKKFASYYRARVTEIKTDINTSNIKITELNKTKIAINKQLNELNVDEKVQTGEIKIKLNSDELTKVNLKLTYNVKDAGWFPIYDLKATKINEPIQLEYKAHIYQNTGCDWEDVNLVLSTNDPNTNNEKPILNPKYLNFINAYSNYTSQRATKSYNYKYNPLVKNVSGIVTSSSDGLPLPGVNIIEKGTSNGTSTDFDGHYSLKTTTGNTLQFSYLGFEIEELPIHSSIMNVSLNEDTNALEEVVVVGYSTTNSSSSYVKPEYNSQEIVNRLYGKAAGVTIRGASTINNKNNPLFIIDGVAVKSNAAKNIDPNSIADIEVLKGTNATSIYGNRASDGVIVITTKNHSTRKTNDLGIVVDTGITNTRFEIDKTYSIPSDGDITVIDIDKFSLPATYDYFAAPILNENVFLTAKIGNWEKYNLLPAEANVYFEGSFSGKTNINPNATTDSLTISLGVDPNISVKRKQLNDFKKSTFIGNNKVIYKGFEIEIKNNKTSAIKLTLLDRIPITQNRAIKVDDIITGNSIYNKDKGILEWQINLESGEQEKVEYSYSVKYPKEKRVNL